MTAPPALVHYATVAEYKRHFERAYCRTSMTTQDGIRVYFKPQKFGHVFYESSQRDGNKDQFSNVRAERIDWIKATLEHPQAVLFQGWNKDQKCYDPARRVAIAHQDFVVVLEMSLNQAGQLKASFVTCYVADNSINKIRTSPLWTLQACMALLQA